MIREAISKLEAKKSSTEPIYYDADGGYYNAVGSVMKFLRGFGPSTEKKIMNTVLYDRTDKADVDYKGLVKNGYLSKSGDTYTITDKGRDVFKRA